MKFLSELFEGSSGSVDKKDHETTTEEYIGDIFEDILRAVNRKLSWSKTISRLLHRRSSNCNAEEVSKSNDYSTRRRYTASYSEGSVTKSLPEKCRQKRWSDGAIFERVKRTIVPRGSSVADRVAVKMAARRKEFKRMNSSDRVEHFRNKYRLSKKNTESTE